MARRSLTLGRATHGDTEVWAVVVAAGTGSRFGGFKQFESLGGRQVLERSLSVCRSCCHGVVAVVPPGHENRCEGPDAVVAGAPTRAGSVRAGLGAVPARAGVIVVHDGVRPLAAPRLFEEVVAAVLSGADAAVPCSSLPDTVKRVGGGKIIETLDRRELVVAQTPQAFEAGTLRRAHAGEPESTDDAALVERCGGRVVPVQGDPRNIKITDAADLDVAEALLRSCPTA